MKNVKKLLSIFICVAIVFSAVPFAGIIANAEGETFSEGYYTYTVSNGKATITDCDISISGNITIPKKLGGYPVTIIGDYAFKYCKKITNLTIPAGIRSIDKSAFGFCTGLKEVYISKGVVFIEDSAFYQS